jgi:hypothetical protein
LPFGRNPYIELGFTMKKLSQQVLAGVIALTLLSTAANAGVKVRVDEVAQIETVAVVGYSFWRDVEFEEASLFKMKQEAIELTDTDAEYLMMQEADERVLEALRALGTFTVIPREEVLANELYQSETKDPESKLAMNWYFPKGYQVIKLKKKNAVALCEALGVDAVVLIEFKHGGGTKGSSWGGVYSKEKTLTSLKGEITMFDRNGKELISGSTKSETLEKGSTRGWGNQDNGVSVEVDAGKANPDEFYPGLLSSYMSELNEDLSQK